ncbi:MAG: T9SS type A sorting domain-containing protein, partial [Candidatus Kapabacteria bacterium]|nr:T9SS type A sorting domain-containing protein [Candidatus Kapabacteria bacterium]
RDRQVALNIWGQLDTNISLPAAQLLLVLDIPNQLFMPTGVRSRAGRIQSFNSRTHDRHIITITVDTLLTMISPQPAVILQLIGDAMLGDRQCDSMFIVNARWTNAGLKPTTWINRGTGNGQLCVTLCGAGGPRLLGSTLELPLLTIQPNPAQESTTVTIAAAERGSYSLEVISLEGTVIDRRELGVLTAGQQYTYSLNLSSVANGVYLLRLKTPTSIVVRPFVRLD